ncbi:hypothetical protein [Nonlabens xiamenensis]|uniref:hypothetical protein n=1 Tax=Nonlabens xiamenensis TaxID=2341043 RepID=UPI000F615513|nr:hypothetical protein [Nonlabens xiamenensis]
MAKITKAILLCTALLLIGCSRKIYEFDDGKRKSQFILKNSRFTYVEESNAESFRSAGTFSATDTSIVFNFRKSLKLPFSHATKNIKVISSVNQNEIPEITVINSFDDFPEFDAQVILRDAELKTLERLETDFDGKVKIKEPSKVYEVEISNKVGSGKSIFKYKPYANSNIQVHLLNIDYGGEPIETPCLSVLIEPIITADILRENETDKVFVLNNYKYKLIE